MDLFKLGLRNVLGITLPGTILVLIFVYVLFSVLSLTGNSPVKVVPHLKDQQLLLLMITFLLSYTLGSLMRLNAADSVDGKSAKYLEARFPSDIRKALLRDAGQEEQLSDAEILDKVEDCKSTLRDLTSGTRSWPDMDLVTYFDRWVWRVERFPYPVWQTRKLQNYRDREAADFYDKRKGQMGIASGKPSMPLPEYRGKEFFNYCKLAVYHAGPELGAGLVQEVQFAEAIVRFYAGTYYALLISMWALLALFGLQGCLITFGTDRSALRVVHVCVTILLAAAIWRMTRMIVQRFRTLRLKEVDTVYDAFYLVHSHCAECKGER